MTTLSSSTQNPVIQHFVDGRIQKEFNYLENNGKRKLVKEIKLTEIIGRNCLEYNSLCRKN